MPYVDSYFPIYCIHCNKIRLTFSTSQIFFDILYITFNFKSNNLEFIRPFICDIKKEHKWILRKVRLALIRFELAT